MHKLVFLFSLLVFKLSHGETCLGNCPDVAQVPAFNSNIEQVRGNQCTTPNGNTGVCVPLDTCQVVFNAMCSRNSSDIEFAKKSRCGYDVEELVCCESPGSAILSDFGISDWEVCGLVKEKPRIMGGKITGLGEFPWIAQLNFKLRGTSKDAMVRCGGSLINNRYVVTVAHCLLHKNIELSSVWLGDWDLSTDPDCIELVANKECADPAKKLKIKEQIPHPFYDEKLGYNDIGLIRLENEVEFTDYIKPICLPSTSLPAPKFGTLVTVAGWGIAENNGSNFHVKSKIEVPVAPNEDCQSKLKLNIRPQQLCAGGNRAINLCEGDTGQPLMRLYEDKSKDQIKWFQDGISILGVPCERPEYPAIFTRVSSYMNWIQKVISEE